MVDAMLPIMVIPNSIKVRICEHLEIENNKLMAIQEHLLSCNYSPHFEDFSILTREINDLQLKIMESQLIAHDKPILNKKDFSFLLELFSYNISGCHMMFYHII